MKTAKRFKIVDFTNPSGARAYRVTGTLDGKTIRKNFKTKSEAVVYRQQMDVEFLNQESDGQTVWTTLTHDQNRDAIAAVNLLNKSKSKKSLTFAVKYLLEHYKEAAETKLVEEAVLLMALLARLGLLLHNEAAQGGDAHGDEFDWNISKHGSGPRSGD